MKTRWIMSLLLSLAVFASAQNIPAQLAGNDGPILKTLKPALDVINGDVVFAHTKKLASDEFEGRGPGTHGETLTVNYLVDQFKRSVLKPGNPDGTFVQNVPLVGYQTVPQIDVVIGLL